MVSRRRPGDWGRSGVFQDRLGRLHRYRWLCERRRMQALDAAGLEFRVEVFRIPYYFAGRPRTYVTDLVVWWHENGRTVTRVEEIKPRIRWNDAQNHAKWAAARQWCANRGFLFQVLDEQALLKPHPSANI